MITKIVVKITPIDKKYCDDGCRYWNIYSVGNYDHPEGKRICDIFDKVLGGFEVTERCEECIEAEECMEVEVI